MRSVLWVPRYIDRRLQTRRLRWHSRRSLVVRTTGPIDYESFIVRFALCLLVFIESADRRRRIDRKPMSKKLTINGLVLDSFGLPATFPPDMMPEAAHQVVADTKSGMSAADLIRLAKSRGFQPIWQAFPHMIEGNVFGLGLNVHGMQVPLMAKMTRLTQPQVPPVAQPTQDSLLLGNYP